MYRTTFAFGMLVVLLTSSFPPADSPVDHQTGVLLEAINYDWCHGDCGPFNTEVTLICLQVDRSTLVGDRKIGSDWREYYPKLSATQGKSISVHYDERSIWVSTDVKEFRFHQRYDEDVMRTPACTAEIHRHMLKRLGDVTRPASVPADAVLIPEGGRFFWHYYSWVRCSFDSTENDDICTYWDKAGRKDYEDHVVSDRNRMPVPQPDLQVDPYTTRHNEVRLRNGIALVSDGRSRINGKLISDQPKP